MHTNFIHQLHTGSNAHTSVSVSSANTGLIEQLLTIIVGTKQVRYGSNPSDNTLAVVSGIIKRAVQLNVPIPVLVPWGGRKTVAKELVDVAEISAIQQLVNLDNEVKKLYPLGLQTNIRIEDTGAFWLYQDDNDLDTHRYSFSVMSLVHILRGKANINPVRESSFMDKDEYFCHSKFASDIIKKYLLATDGLQEVEHMQEYKDMVAIGWKGKIPQDQRSYYYNRYKAGDINISIEKQAQMLADYLGGAKARYDLNGRCEPVSPVDKYIQITFVPPVPGSPAGMFDSTLYYRTIPMNDGRSHICAWRGKGYVHVEKTGEVKTKLCSWYDKEVHSSLISRVIEVKDEVTGATIKIQADYRVEQLN